ELIESFDTAFQIEGMQGSGERLIVPVDTVGRSAVLELLNTTSDPITVNVDLVWGSGSTRLGVALAPHGTHHLVLDQILGPTQVGYAVVQGDKAQSTMAVGMHYGRRPDLGVDYMYGVHGQ